MRESPPSAEGHSSTSVSRGYAERLDLPLEADEAREVDQLAGLFHRQLLVLREVPMGHFEPPVAFRPGGTESE